MPDLYQDVSWPGIVAVESMSGTVSHGIQPALFQLVTLPQTLPPSTYGDLVFSDRVHGTISLRNCKVDRITSSTGPGGTTWRLEILDRRWQWAFGRIDGLYNRTDPRGKLIPWSIRSPTELAVLCLEAMGERGYKVDLPPGLPRSIGLNLARYLLLGENFPQSVSNPPAEWLAVPPAQALARLADRFGCRVVYSPMSDTVSVVPLGKGITVWPSGWPAEEISPTDDPPEAPSAVGVVGAPIRYQMRFLLEPVGQDWDGQYVPIDQLTYTPTLTSTSPQITDVRFDDPDYQWGGTVDGVQWVSAFGTPASAATSFIAFVNGTTSLAKVCTAAAGADTQTVRLTGVAAGVSFAVTIESQATITPIQPAISSRRTWQYGNVNDQQFVTPTDRLSITEARNLANSTVWQCYRITNLAPDETPLVVPGSPVPLLRRQQIVLQGTKVEQVVPEPRDKDGVPSPPGNPQIGVLPDFYNGYSRDQKATVTGSVAYQIGGVKWLTQSLVGGGSGSNPLANTPFRKKLYTDFDIGSVEQIVRFSEPVYYRGAAGTIEKPTLILETACYVENPETGQVVRAALTKPVGGPAPIEWQVFDDVEYAVIGQYTSEADLVTGVVGQLVGASLTDFGDATKRAQVYLNAMASRYQQVKGQSRRFIGLRAIDLSGTIQQVTWEIGPGGCSTTGSINTEHSSVIPAYPARRRIENLQPNSLAVLANLSDRGSVPNPVQVVAAKSQGGV